MAQKLDPEKYTKQFDAIQREAEQACIELLKTHGTKHALIAGEGDDGLWHFALNTDDEMLQLHSYKVDSKGKLFFMAWYEESGDDYNDGEWTPFEGNVKGQFHHIYAILADCVDEIE